MSFRHSMTCFTEGIRVTVPMRWRSLDGMVGVFWRAEGQADARGYYLSPDPRIVIFFNDVSSHIRVTNDDRLADGQWRPMTRAIYVPAGVPLWTSFTATHRFSHLDLHVHQDRALRFLCPTVGRSAALSALRRPVEIQDTGAVEALAALLADEVASPAKHAVYAESLVGGIVSGLLDLGAAAPGTVSGGLTRAQMRRLESRLADNRTRRLSVAEMAETVGLSPSWFAAAFKKTTGKTPHSWQLEQRIGAAERLLLDGGLSLAEIAVQLGFSDQAHLTKAFRQVLGQTPAAWRRMQLVQ